MGIGAVTSMAIAPPTESGQIFDLRTALINSTTFIGGPMAGAITCAFSTLARLAIGGPGTLPGLVSIGLAFLGSIAAYRICRTPPRWWQLIIFTVTISILGLSAYLFVPSPVRADLFRETAIPFAVLTAIATLMASSVLMRIEVRRALVLRNQAYATMVENLPDCLNLKDVDGRFQIANSATAMLMKAGSARELIGKTDFDFYPADMAQTFKEDEKVVLASGEPKKIEQKFVDRSGEEGWLATLKAPLYNERNEIVGLITHNREITSEKRAADVKNQFVSTVSHELRTPLTAIRGAMGLLAGGVLPDVSPKARKLIDIASSNSERLVELINDILDMERIELGKVQMDLTSTMLRPVIDQTVAEMENYLPERGVKIYVVDHAGGAHAFIDDRRMKQVLTNLISNAIKFSRENSVVTITLSSVGEPPHMRISVHNNGTPIADAFKDRIFQKFERSEEGTSQLQGGTGLGLAIAKSLINHMNGEIWFESSADTGTTFHVDLPDNTDISRVAVSPAGLAQKNDVPKVLVIEHDEAARIVMSDALRKAGYGPVGVSSMSEARAVLNGDIYEVILVDLDLVNEAFERLFDDLKKDRPKQTVVIVAAEADGHRRAMIGRTFTIADWITRPVDPQRVVQSVGAIRALRADGRQRVLHVEDDQDVLTVIRDQFDDDVEVWHATTLRDAHNLVKSTHFDVVILDVALPDGSGLDLLAHLEDDTSIVVFSALDLELKLGGRIKSILTKTKAAEIDVVAAVTRQLGRDAPTGT